MSFLTKSIAFAAVVGGCGSVDAQTITCDANLDNSIAVGINAVLTQHMSIPHEAVNSFADTMRFMDFDEPDTLDDVDPPVQSTLFNTVVNQATDLDYGGFVGFESGGEFLLYRPRDNVLRYRAAGAYDANVDQLSVYNYDSLTGMSNSDAIDAYPYDPRIRGWYNTAKDACTTDLLGVVTCSFVWSDFYVFSDGVNIGTTAALGFTDDSGTVFSGVVGLDYATESISEILASATANNNGAVSYVMERDGKLVGTSNGAAVVSGGARLNAQDSADANIAASANYLLDNYYRADQSLVVGDKVYTMQNFQVDDLQWYIVVVENYEQTASCKQTLVKDTRTDTFTDLDSFLGGIVECGNAIERAMFLGIIPYDSPDDIDLDNGVQELIFSISNNYVNARTAYIGWEDGTSMSYGEKTDNEFYQQTIRPRDGSSSTLRKYYRTDPDTGRSTSGVYQTKTYDARTRPWYVEAKAAGVPIYSSIFVFATGGNLGITYAIPIYDGTTFIGVVGIDFEMVAVDAILEAYASTGSGMYLMETAETSSADAFDMVASSCKANVADSTTSTQYKAYNIADVEDYYIATSASYMKDNNFVDDGEIVMDDFTTTVTRYDKYTLNWHLVSYEVTYPDTSSSVGSGSGSSTDDDIETVQILSEAILAVLVLAFIALIVVLVLVTKGASNDTSKAPLNQGVAMSDVSKA